MTRYLPLVRDFAARVSLYHDAVAQTLGLHATDVKILRLLEAEPMTAGAIAEQSGLTGAAITALVDRLEAAGYAKRERDSDDRRRVTIRAVPEKLAALDRAYAGLNVEMVKLLGTYKDAEFAAILDYLVKGKRVLVEQTTRLRGRPAK